MDISRKIITSLLLSILSLHCFSDDTVISFNDIKKAPLTWKLVTVRYREDNKEMRFIYANDIAFKAIQSQNLPYPDGAMFVKLGVKTLMDPAFAGSMFPGGVHRYQLMIKNSKKYKNNDGWNYSLWINNRESGNLTVDELNSCHACHELVEDRDFVFSTAMGEGNIEALATVKNPIQFSYVPFSQLPKEIAVYFKSGDIIQKAVTTISKAVFEGTIDELKPLLINNATSNKRGVFFISDDKKFFLIVKPEASKDCSKNILIISKIFNKDLQKESICR